MQTEANQPHTRKKHDILKGEEEFKPCEMENVINRLHDYD